MAQGAAEKYHHTLTMSLLSILYRAQQMPAMVQEWPVFLAQCDDVLHDAKAVLFQYYSDDRLNQDVARRAFVPPGSHAATDCLSVPTRKRSLC
jgi:hypothetical protein